jgi:hypothetical protein
MTLGQTSTLHPIGGVEQMFGAKQQVPHEEQNYKEAGNQGAHSGTSQFCCPDVAPDEPGRCDDVAPEIKRRKMKLILAFALALPMLTAIAAPTPAVAGWCIEACGLKRVPRQQQTREVVCTTVRRGNYTETVCTRS